MASLGWRPASKADRSAMQAGFPASAPASCRARTQSGRHQCSLRLQLETMRLHSCKGACIIRLSTLNVHLPA